MMTDRLGNEIPLRIEMVNGHAVPLHPEECEPHTPSPDGYMQWHAWADRMEKTHIQRQCHGCGLWAVWEQKPDETREDGEREH